jgi:uncharacterized protein YneF (UPF0154 family)
MSKLLTIEQIEELHEFCYFRGVFHYDVQIEIVDHLATAIEKLWETNPILPFDEAMYTIGEQFGGDLGFSTFSQEKEKAVRKKYRRLLWQFVADYYRFPKIIVTIMLTLSIFTALYFSENDQWIIVSLVALFFGFSLFYGLYYRPKYVRLKVKKGYSFLLNEISIKGLLYKTGVGFSGVFIHEATHQEHFSTTGSIIFSLLVSLYIVLLYGDCFFISKKIKEHFKEQFPQFVIA